MKQSFCIVIVLRVSGHSGPKHVGVSDFCNIIVTLIQLCAFVGLNFSNLINMKLLVSLR